MKKIVFVSVPRQTNPIKKRVLTRSKICILTRFNVVKTAPFNDLKTRF